MTGVEVALGSVLVLVGLRAAALAFGRVQGERGGTRVWVALHETARAGFWLSLGAFFIGYALLPDLDDFRWFVLLPIALAGLRLVAATLLGRSEPPRTR